MWCFELQLCGVMEDSGDLSSGMTSFFSISKN